MRWLSDLLRYQLMSLVLIVLPTSQLQTLPFKKVPFTNLYFKTPFKRVRCLILSKPVMLQPARMLMVLYTVF